MSNQNIPAAVKQALVKEVNYGCPVDDCGIPYLTFHHFDPPWKEEQHNRPEGMIALCVYHATHADQGHYTKKQQKLFKKNPFVKTIATGRIEHSPECIVFLLGRNVFIGERAALTIEGTEILSARCVRDDDELRVIMYWFSVNATRLSIA